MIWSRIPENGGLVNVNGLLRTGSVDRGENGLNQTKVTPAEY